MQPPPGYGPPGAPPPFGGYPPPGGGYPPPGGYRPPPQKDPSESAANTALILSIVGVFLCCAPVGAAGGYFGLKSMKLAKEGGKGTPGKALASVILASLSLVLTVGVIVGAIMEERRKAERIAEADEKTKGKIEGKDLEKKVACALLEKQLLKGLYNDTTSVDDVKCSGDLDVDKDKGTAVLPRVTAKVVTDSKVFTACFARAKRWFVVSVVEGAEGCPGGSYESKLGKGASDTELEAEEDDLRKTAKNRAQKAVVETLEKKLADVRDVVKDDDHKEKACGKLDVSKWTAGADGRLLVSTIDFDAMKDFDETTGKTDWSFLTSDRIKKALDDKAGDEERAKAAREVLAGPYVVVYVSDERDWPEAMMSKGLFKKKGFVGGGLSGWMVVVDTSQKTPKIACEAQFNFENSKSVAVSKYAGDKELATALSADLKKNYETAATAKIKDLTGGKLRLGLSGLD
ncbi:MAG: DUF4190 domain-containing protein [Polyangiales bacterium]